MHFFRANLFSCFRPSFHCAIFSSLSLDFTPRHFAFSVACFFLRFAFSSYQFPLLCLLLLFLPLQLLPLLLLIQIFTHIKNSLHPFSLMPLMFCRFVCLENMAKHKNGTNVINENSMSSIYCREQKTVSYKFACRKESYSVMLYGKRTIIFVSCQTLCECQWKISNTMTMRLSPLERNKGKVVRMKRTIKNVYKFINKIRI